MSFQQFVVAMRARWLMVLTILGVVVVGTSLVMLLSTKQYMAYATVVADVKPDPIEQAVFPAQLLSSYISTQVDIISSQRVARRAVEILKLDQDARSKQQWQRATKGRGEFTAWMAENLQSHLVVTPSRESNVINIAVQWPDGKTAAAVANTFAQAYIDTNISLKVEPAKQYTEWFNEQSTALRAQLEVKQKALYDFERDKGIVATDGRVDIEGSRLSELSSQLVAIQAQSQDSLSREQQRGSLDALPEVLLNPLVINLKTQLAAAEIKGDKLRSRLGKNHPDYLQNEAEITGLRERIAQESAKIVSSIDTTTRVNIQRQSETSGALEAQKQRLLKLKRQRDEAADLQNDVLTAQRNLDAVNQRLAQTSLESLTQQTNVVLLTPATEPLHPSSPKVRLNIVLATFLGTLLGVGTALSLELRDRRVRGDEELSKLLGVPLLGKVGSTSRVRLGVASAASGPRKRISRLLEPTIE